MNKTLNEKMAEVMGWKYLEVPNVVADGFSCGYTTEKGEWINKTDWHPADNYPDSLSQAMMCVEKFCNIYKKHSVEIYMTDNGFDVWIEKMYDKQFCITQNEYSKLPLAICEAILEAMEIDND